jgi:hypothetical protein
MLVLPAFYTLMTLEDNKLQVTHFSSVWLQVLNKAHKHINCQQIKNLPNLALKLLLQSPSLFLIHTTPRN